MKQRIKLRRKGLFFIVVLILCGLNTDKVYAQEWDYEYVPFVEEGKIWNCVLADNIFFEEEASAYDCIFTMRGDSVIGKQNYKKVYCEFEKYYGDKKQHYYCAVREESYRVFFVEQNEKDEKLLCDFSSPLEKLILYRGDFQYGRSQGMHILESKGLFMFSLMGVIDGEVSDIYGLGTAWVEGVGNLGNPFALEFWHDEPKLGSLIYVYSCIKDDEIIFEEWWTETCDNPLTQVITTTKSTSHNIYYDLQGRSVKSTLKHGIYVKDGRKVVR